MDPRSDKTVVTRLGAVLPFLVAALVLFLAYVTANPGTTAEEPTPADESHAVEPNTVEPNEVEPQQDGPQEVQASLPGSAYLSLLPDGEMKRQFILDCTGCHVWTEDWVLDRQGGIRDRAAWSAAVQDMLNRYGQGTGFPIISSWPDPVELGDWLEQHFSLVPEETPYAAGATVVENADITEYDVPVPGDLPHDLMVEPSGYVLITGMFTHRMYRLDPESGEFANTPIPVGGANPRALDIDAEGRWVALLGAPGAVARHDPQTGEWEDWTFGAYPHSVHVGPDGLIWWNGHFTVDPEVIGSLDPETGEVTRYDVPWLATSDSPEGESTIPYGLRVTSEGIVWATQLRGGHLIRFDPASGEIDQFKMPTSHSGPRRPDIGPDGQVWIPGYSSGTLVRFDPETERFTEWPFPVADALPYVVRVDQRTGLVWMGTGHGDVLASFDPSTEAFTVYPLPTRGALIRHIDVDEERGEVWAAYGASPGPPSKVARLRP